MRYSAFFFFILISFIATPNFAQESKVKKPFRAWVRPSSEAKMDRLRGPAYLVELKDSSFIFAYLVDVKQNSFLIEEYQVSEIDKIKFRQEKIVGRSVLISTLAGFTIGGILGGSQGGNSYVGPETTTEAVFVYGSIIGVIAATFIGSAFSLKTRVVIKGNQTTYETKKEILTKFLVNLENLPGYIQKK